MKTKPLGRKLERNLTVNIVSLAVGLFFFTLKLPFYDVVCCVCIVALFVTLVRIIGLLSDGAYLEYGFWGHKRSNPFYTFEPGDPDYEKEKPFQDDGDIEIKMDINVRTPDGDRS